MPRITQMKMLINLALIDGVVTEHERNYIVNIGRANGIYPDEILPLFEQKHDLSFPRSLSADDRFEYLLSLVQLMKIDERMYKDEIVYCSQVATKLGYNQQIMFDLMLYVKASDMDPKHVDTLKAKVQKHLKI